MVPSLSLSPDKVVAGPSHASPPDDFKEHQALLRRLASNLGLEDKDLAKQ